MRDKQDGANVPFVQQPTRLPSRNRAPHPRVGHVLRLIFGDEFLGIASETELLEEAHQLVVLHQPFVPAGVDAIDDLHIIRFRRSRRGIGGACRGQQGQNGEDEWQAAQHERYLRTRSETRISGPIL